MSSGAMPRSSAQAQAAFRSLLPDDAAVNTRPMFGNLAAFVNGNMFAGLFGEELFVRLTDADRGRLLEEGGADFAPVAGRVMKGYVTLPAGWAERPEATRELIGRALEWICALPAKQPRKSTGGGRR
jgi:TfoX/Sxy family transcriptional regulator of competence genes